MSSKEMVQAEQAKEEIAALCLSVSLLGHFM